MNGNANAYPPCLGQENLKSVPLVLGWDSNLSYLPFLWEFWEKFHHKC